MKSFNDRRLGGSCAEGGSMKRKTTYFIFGALLLPTLSCGEGDSQLCKEAAPPVTMPRLPYSPLVFSRVDGGNNQTLSLQYSRAGAVNFEFRKTGSCDRQDRGTATIKPCWWLGAESDENEAGETIFVQEYRFKKDEYCTMYLRIGEGDWKQATISESEACSKSCPASGEIMHLRKR